LFEKFDRKAKGVWFLIELICFWGFSIFAIICSPFWNMWIAFYPLWKGVIPRIRKSEEPLKEKRFFIDADLTASNKKKSTTSDPFWNMWNMWNMFKRLIPRRSGLIIDNDSQECSQEIGLEMTHTPFCHDDKIQSGKSENLSIRKGLSGNNSMVASTVDELWSEKDLVNLFDSILVPNDLNNEIFDKKINDLRQEMNDLKQELLESNRKQLEKMMEIIGKH
jgi:hypothetical protein